MRLPDRRAGRSHLGRRMSYRIRDPLRVVGEVTKWTGHSPEQLKAMKDRLVQLERLGTEAIED